MTGEWGTEWEVHITRAGRWTWSIDPVKGLTGLSLGYTSFGSQERAQRKAQRILARLRRDDARMADTRVIR